MAGGSALQSTYDIEIKAADYDEIASLWQALESATATNIFLSWLWVGVWLKTYQPKVELLVVRYQGQCVGLGLLTKKSALRHRFLHSQILRFGRTGNQQQDQIWPEYAGVLLQGEHQASAPAAIIDHLLTNDAHWDEIELAAMSEKVLLSFECATLNKFESWSAPAYGVDLRALRGAGKNYLQSVSRNTRYQINRCKKRYAQTAVLKFDVLKTPEAIEAVWPIMAELHRKKWQHTEEKKRLQ